MDCCGDFAATAVGGKGLNGTSMALNGNGDNMTPTIYQVSSLTRSEIARLFGNVRITQSGCWKWIGVTRRGYSRISFRNEKVAVHRLFFAWLVQAIPRGVGRSIPQLDHLCRNRSCVNPAHLELVSMLENIARSEGKTALSVRNNQCLNGHDFTATNTILHNGGRLCRICRNERQRTHRKAQRAARRAQLCA